VLGVPEEDEALPSEPPPQALSARVDARANAVAHRGKELVFVMFA
jgi:hypothetical protein